METHIYNLEYLYQCEFFVAARDEEHARAIVSHVLRRPIPNTVRIRDITHDLCQPNARNSFETASSVQRIIGSRQYGLLHREAGHRKPYSQYRVNDWIAMTSGRHVPDTEETWRLLPIHIPQATS